MITKEDVLVVKALTVRKKLNRTPWWRLLKRYKLEIEIDRLLGLAMKESDKKHKILKF
jgi:hypothetical protein